MGIDSSFEQDISIVTNTPKTDNLRKSGFQPSEVDARDLLYNGAFVENPNLGNGSINFQLNIASVPRNETAKPIVLAARWVDKEHAKSYLQHDIHARNEDRALWHRIIDEGHEGVIVVTIGTSTQAYGYSEVIVKVNERGEKYLEGPLKLLYYPPNPSTQIGGLPDNTNYRNSLNVGDSYKGLGFGELLVQTGNLVGRKVFKASERLFTTDATNYNNSGSYYVNRLGAKLETRPQVQKGEKAIPILNLLYIDSLKPENFSHYIPTK